MARTSSGKSWLFKTVIVLLFMIAGGGGYAGWTWMQQVTVTDIQLRGLVHAEEAVLRELIAVDSGHVMFQIDASKLENRLRRHPWIMQASVSRLPTGMLDIQVVERHPVAQVLGSSGQIEYYLDRGGFRMPVTDHSFYPVPVVSGRMDPYHPVTPVKDEVMKDLLFVLPRLGPDADALLSEVRRTREGIEVLTTPVGESGAISVKMGADDFERKFETLTAFWAQEILRHQNVVYASIDLRFNGRVVAREMPVQLPQ